MACRPAKARGSQPGAAVRCSLSLRRSKLPGRRQRYGRTRLGGRRLAGCGILLRLERPSHAVVASGLARYRGGGRAAFRLEELGLRVVGDVVAADLVGPAFQDRVVEELELLAGAVVLSALRPALVIPFGVVAL